METDSTLLAEQKARLGAERKRFAALLAALLLAAAGLPFFTSIFQTQLLTGALILGITAMSFALLAGFGGMISMAQMAFYGMASYAMAITSKTWGWPPLASAGFAVACSIALAAVFGLIAVRAAGVYFLIMTLALLQIFYGVAMQWNSVTGGYNGIAGIPRPTLFGFSLGDPTTLFYVALATTASVYLLLRRMLHSPFGLIVQGIRDNPVRMAALGVRVQRHRWLTLVISGAVAGVAGVLGTFHYGVVNPEVAGLSTSVLVVLAARIGGVDRLFTPVLGAVVVSILVSIVSYMMQQLFGTSRYWTIIGAIFVIVVILRESYSRRGWSLRGLLASGRGTRAKSLAKD